MVFEGTKMKVLSVKLENCYGLKKLEIDFSFEKSNANLIYAANGAMKTSFAKTFYALSKEKKPEEKMYNKIPSYEIKVDGVDINSEDILVIKPFDKEFESENISTLLVNSAKKSIYDKILKEILEAKKKLINELNKQSKIKKDDIEAQLTKDLETKDIFSAIEMLQKLNLGNLAYSKIQYQAIFDPKVIELLGNQEVINNIKEYTQKYNELIEQSLLFKKGIFNPTKASSVSSALKKEMFFEANHKVLLDGKAEAIENHLLLEQSFETEKEKILGNGSLQEISKKIISGVAPVKVFQELLESYPEISTDLADIDNLKKIIWCSYYDANKVLFDELLSLFQTNKTQIIQIESEANVEATKWYDAHKIFKDRFHVPFSMEIENHTSAILGTTKPEAVFTFEGENGEKLIFNRGKLDSLDFLSVGERRALYLLYVIFDFLERQSRGKPSLVVIDDIADSFDYKNKYAIIEYLKELSEHNLIRLIILTHNFDFYRTFQSRILVDAQWENSYVAQKNIDGVKLLKGGSKDVASPFELWKKNYHKNAAMLVSMIPFVRNLVEYKEGNACNDYAELTSLLHIKSDTSNFMLSDLEILIKKTVKGEKLDTAIIPNCKVIEHIYKTAEEICNLKSENEICLENKITLSIAIRLKAEEFMLSEVKDKPAMTKNQTFALFDRFVREGDHNDEEFKNRKKVLGQVILMTPESIHLNSFMYEPLMDMSSLHLTKLLTEVKNLFP